jgi:hypothetical protein
MPSVPMDYQPPATIMLIVTRMSIDYQPLATVTLTVAWMSSRCPGQQLALLPTCNRETCCATHDILLPASSLHTDFNDTCVPISLVSSDNHRMCTESAVVWQCA